MNEFSEVQAALAAARSGLLRAQIEADKVGAGGQFQDGIADALAIVEQLLRDAK